MARLASVLFIFAFTIFSALPVQGERSRWPPVFVHSKIATTFGGLHSTTRGTIRLVFPHQGRWLVFRGNPDSYHFSRDGLTWTATQARQASRSHLIRGNEIYTIYWTVNRSPGTQSPYNMFACKGIICGNTIQWGKSHPLDTRLGYYPDLRQDTNGYFTVTGRAILQKEQNEIIGEEVLWKRTGRPNDISKWGPDVRCINHVGDPLTGKWWRKVGSTVHENVTLEDGKSYVFAMMTVAGEGKLYGNLYDGERWGATDIELATGMSTWRGTDRRMCAVFDKASRVIHLAYVDGGGALWHRRATSPYGAADWTDPIRLQPFKTFSVVLSLDTSQRPAHVYVLFGKTLFEDRNDLRNTYGALYLQRFDGSTWSEPILVSEQGTEDNWYPNMNEEIRHGIGVLYLKGSRLTRQGEKPPLDIMFACTGPTR